MNKNNDEIKSRYLRLAFNDFTLWTVIAGVIVLCVAHYNLSLEELDVYSYILGYGALREDGIEYKRTNACDNSSFC